MEEGWKIGGLGVNSIGIGSIMYYYAYILDDDYIVSFNNTHDTCLLPIC